MAAGTRWSDAKVGLFVLAALTLLILGSLWVAGSTRIGPPRVPYDVLLQNSGGIQIGDRVRVSGVNVGRVRDIDLDPGAEWPVVVRVLVRSSVPIHEGATARITSAGFLGSNHLEIDVGPFEAPLLAPEGRIVGQSRPGFEQALGRVDDISDRLVVILDRTAVIVDEVAREIGPLIERVEGILSEENAENLTALIASLRSISEESGPRLGALLGNLESVSGSMDRGLADLPELTAKLSGMIDDVRRALGADGDRLAGVLEAAESSLRSAEDSMGAIVENRDEIDATLRDLRDASANLKAFSRIVKERPYSLVRVKVPPDRNPGDGVRQSK